ncbi:hypothetical protein D5R81_12005 [Parashewanella spongiae]|uniref:Uncharacterized protein n=1 Tax=Parashewanella spongiae TaxID=342950 RepID=A0A3A6TKL6_9GAMM|nr:hypothetical protein [Parashewanella spongiae]MCL1078642.1 hypothetical protein [Parashewanella spongiae]RJY12965.1 hypothetical protein D5R81_12005 [Parashewanella spongiae]
MYLKGAIYSEDCVVECTEIHSKHQSKTFKYDGELKALNGLRKSDKLGYVPAQKLMPITCFYRWILVLVVHLILFMLLIFSWNASDRVFKMEAIQVIEQQSHYRAYVYRRPKIALVKPIDTPSQAPSKPVQVNAEEVVEPVEVTIEPIEALAEVDETTPKSIESQEVTKEPTPKVKFDVKKATAAFLQQRSMSRLTELSKQQRLSEHYGSASVITPDMKPLILIKTETLEKQLSLDSELDPQRIERIGNTCRRVVNIGDVIDPYRTTMGHPMKCGYSEQEKALQQALSERLNKFKK